MVSRQIYYLIMSSADTTVYVQVAHTRLVCERQTRITGSHGELIGDMSTSTITVTNFRTREVSIHTPASEGTGHGGGDTGVMKAFVKAVAERDQAAMGCMPRDVLRSHLLVFAAEEARLRDEVVRYREFEERLGIGQEG